MSAPNIQCILLQPKYYFNICLRFIRVRTSSSNYDNYVSKRGIFDAEILEAGNKVKKYQDFPAKKDLEFIFMVTPSIGKFIHSEEIPFQFIPNSRFPGSWETLSSPYYLTGFLCNHLFMQTIHNLIVHFSPACPLTVTVPTIDILFSHVKARIT